MTVSRLLLGKEKHKKEDLECDLLDRQKKLKYFFMIFAAFGSSFCTYWNPF